MILPKVIIGGAPKCGTSSLFNWLCDHPSVTGSTPKETFFFMDQDNPLINNNCNYHLSGLSGYQNFFNSADETSLCIEATTHYLYQKITPKILVEFQHPPILFFILRNPSQRVYSSFEFTRNNLAAFSDEISFSDFVKLLINREENKLDRFFYRQESLYVLKRDLLYSQYINYLDYWLKYYDRDHLHLILFEDLIKSPSTVLQRVCKTLTLDDKYFHDYIFKKKNETFEIKNKAFHRRISNLKKWIPDGIIRNHLKSGYRNMQTAKKSALKDNETEHAIKRLEEYFVPFNKQLASTFNLDLSNW